MKIIAQHRSVNPSSELLLCFDVSKDTLNLFSLYEHGGRTFRLEDELVNATGWLYGRATKWYRRAGTREF